MPDWISVSCHAVKFSFPAQRWVSLSKCWGDIRANSATLSCGKNVLTTSESK